MSSLGNLFMVVAPSGAGKSSLVNALLAEDPDIRLSISCTTRPPRPGEQNGREYHFLAVEEFLQLNEAGEFLESAKVHDNYYGTSRRFIEEQMRQGHDVLLEIDWQGARQIRSKFPGAIGIFILPPSIEALETRLKKRGQDSPQVITRRLLAAGSEISHASEFEYVIINQDFAVALKQLSCIVSAARLRYAQQAARQTALFAQFSLH